MKQTKATMIKAFTFKTYKIYKLKIIYHSNKNKCLNIYGDINIEKP